MQTRLNLVIYNLEKYIPIKKFAINKTLNPKKHKHRYYTRDYL